MMRKVRRLEMVKRKEERRLKIFKLVKKVVIKKVV